MQKSGSHLGVGEFVNGREKQVSYKIGSGDRYSDALKGRKNMIRYKYEHGLTSVIFVVLSAES